MKVYQTLRILLSMVITIGIQSCNTSVEQDDEEDTTNESTQSSESSYTIVDTTIAPDIFIEVIGNFSDNQVTVHIENSRWDTTYNLCSVLGKRCFSGYDEHQVRWSTEHFVGLRESCGVPCNYEIVIPIISGFIPTSYFFAYTSADDGINMQRDLIAYNGTSITPDGFPIIKIKNLMNNKVDSIAIDNSWEPRISMNEFIDTLIATKERIMIGQLDSSGKIRISREKLIGLN